MPSPFPGMDPWLEHPAHWPDVHHHLISAIQASLSDQVRPRYVARVEERVTLLDREIHEAYLTLVDVDRREVVTVIEVLSPTNKYPNAEGQKNYLRKQHEVMQSATNLVEIDLLRDGERILVEPGLPECEYIAHISRPGHRPEGLIWPIRLDQRLPILPVPLRPDDDDVRLDLQSALTSFYDRAGYDLILDYAGDPVPPLQATWSRWADEVLHARGVRG